MATAKTIREANGLRSRGNLPRPVIEQWNTDHPDDPYERSTGGALERPGGQAPAVPDYPDDDFDASFPPPSDGVMPPDEDIPPDTGLRETRPRQPARAKRGGGGRSVKALLGGKTGARAGKSKKTPRVSTEDLLGAVWRTAAKFAAPLPPLHRTLRMQAPVAGVLLEDAVKDTLADTLLQPLARLAGTGKAVSALAGPPMIVGAMTIHMQRAQAAGEDPNPVFLSLATEALRTSLMAWMDVAGPKFEEAMHREKEFESRYGQSVDEMIGFLFSPMPATAADAEAEEDAIRRAQQLL